MRPLFRITIILVALATPISAYAAEPTMPQRAEGRSAPDRLIVRLKKDSDRPAIERLLKQNKSALQRQLGKQKTFVIKTSKTQRDGLRKKLLRDKRFAGVELDRGYEPSFTPNDPLFAQQWSHQNLKTPLAWDTTRGSSNRIIAILDSGVDSAHPDLQQRMTSGWNVFDNSSDTTDLDGHGTWVAGSAAGALNNATGVSGVTDATIMPIKITDADGFAYTSTIVDGLAWAQEHGATIANISFAIYAGDSVVTEAARDFTDAGGIVFASAGNDGTEHTNADNPYIVSVGALASTNAVSSFSTRGPFVDLFAPGESIITTSPQNEYVTVNGTSFASPIAAGAAALVWSAQPTLTPNDVVQSLKNTARDGGRVDASAAIALVAPKPASAPPAPENQTASSTPPIQPEPKLEPPPAKPPIETPTSTIEFVFPKSGTTLPHDTYVLQLRLPRELPIQRVEYFDNSAPLGTALEYPYSLIWKARSPAHTSAGSHKIEARITTLATTITVTTDITISGEQANKGKNDDTPREKTPEKKEDDNKEDDDRERSREIPDVREPIFQIRGRSENARPEFVQVRKTQKNKR